MARWTEDPLTPIGILVGAFLVVAAIGTFATAPWQYHGSAAVTVLRIAGTTGMLAVGVGLIYVVWGARWLAARRAPAERVDPQASSSDAR